MSILGTLYFQIRGPRVFYLTHRGQMTHVSVTKHGHIWFRYSVLACPLESTVPLTEAEWRKYASTK